VFRNVEIGIGDEAIIIGGSYLNYRQDSVSVERGRGGVKVDYSSLEGGDTSKKIQGE